MTRVITWNMEGATHSSNSKWVDGVQQLLTKAEADILCLQEAGAAPPSSAAYAPPPPAPTWAGGIAPAVAWSFLTWQPGVPLYYVLWVQTDPAGNRVNLAVVTKDLPDEFRYVANAGGRPAIGVRFGTEETFTLHAQSGGGADAPTLVTNVNAATAAGNSWDAAGDYNRQPDEWGAGGVPAGNLCPPDKATRWKSDKELDYMVRSGAVIEGFVIDTLVLSDHFPVIFDV